MSQNGQARGITIGPAVRYGGAGASKSPLDSSSLLLLSGRGKRWSSEEVP